MRDRFSLELTNDLAQLKKVYDSVEEFGKSRSFKQESLYNIHLALEEILTNIISYAYPDDEIHKIRIIFDLNDRTLLISIVDDGLSFDPTEIEEPRLDDDLNNRKIGGLGLFLVRNTMRKMDYKRDNNHNILELTIDI